MTEAKKEETTNNNNTNNPIGSPGDDNINKDPSLKNASLSYQTGFGNTFESEAIPGALPKGRNNPKHVPMNLYAEQLSGTAFTRPRHVNQRTWLYRQQPSVIHNPTPWTLPKNKNSSSSSCDAMFFGNEDPSNAILDPNPFRWSPFQDDNDDNNGNGNGNDTNTDSGDSNNNNNSANTTKMEKDFISGMHLLGINGDPETKNGLAIYVYMFQKSMDHSYMYNSDGDFLLVPQEGTTPLEIRTELGKLIVSSGDICVIPRGIVFSIHTTTDTTTSSSSPSSSFYRGYLLELFKGHLTLPELGPIGANGLANARDFQYPVAWYETLPPKNNNDSNGDTPMILYNKFGSKLWNKVITETPFNVVAWHGNYVPYKYDLSKFCAINSVTYDHIDPSIYTVLTCAGDETGTALCDFVIFPPRWMSTDRNTFRPPWFHRNTMTEFMGLIHGGYDAKEGFRPGGASLHSCMTPHGPDRSSYDKAIADPCDTPTYFSKGLAFMFETSYMLRLSKYALECQSLERNYGECWEGLPNRFSFRQEGEEDHATKEESS